MFVIVLMAYFSNTKKFIALNNSANLKKFRECELFITFIYCKKL